MDLVPDDKKNGLRTPVWDEYKAIINEAEGREVTHTHTHTHTGLSLISYR